MARLLRTVLLPDEKCSRCSLSYLGKARNGKDGLFWSFKKNPNMSWKTQDFLMSYKQDLRFENV
jgi:hypothetical protein